MLIRTAVSAVRRLIGDNPSRHVLAAVQRDIGALLDLHHGYESDDAASGEGAPYAHRSGSQCDSHTSFQGSQNDRRSTSPSQTVAEDASLACGSKSSEPAGGSVSSRHSTVSEVSLTSSKPHEHCARTSGRSTASAASSAADDTAAAAPASSRSAPDDQAAAASQDAEGRKERAPSASTSRSSNAASSRARSAESSSAVAAAEDAEHVAELTMEVAKLKAQLQAATRGFLRKETALRGELAAVRGDVFVDAAQAGAVGSDAGTSARHEGDPSAVSDGGSCGDIGDVRCEIEEVGEREHIVQATHAAASSAVAGGRDSSFLQLALEQVRVMLLAANPVWRV